MEMILSMFLVRKKIFVPIILCVVVKSDALYYLYISSDFRQMNTALEKISARRGIVDLITNHPILDYQHKEKVTFSFDGRELEGYVGEPIAMALHANGVKVYRETPEMKRPRGFFCAIGKCSSCFMVVDGVPNVRTCVTPLKAGMKVETQRGKGAIPLLSE